MDRLINIYCDESCHLESSRITTENRFMVLGGIACLDDKKQKIFEEIKRIKSDNGLQHYSEVKWAKVSLNKMATYETLIRYFFTCESLTFRAVIIDKNQLKHDALNHSHNDFYYKK
jgi:hypothetical protein